MNLVSAKMPNQLCNYTTASTSQVTQGITYTNYSNGYFSLVGTAINNVSFNFARNISIYANHKYYVHRGGAYIRVYSTSVLDSGSADSIFTALADATVMLYSMIYANESFNITFAPMLIDLTELYGAGNEPSTVEAFRADYPLDYYPYSATSYTGLLKQNGKLVSTDLGQMLPSYYKVVNAGELTWNRAIQSTNRVIYYAYINDIKPAASCFLVDKKYPNRSMGVDKSYTNEFFYYNKAIQVRNDTDYETAEEFKTSMENTIFIYEKATT